MLYKILEQTVRNMWKSLDCTILVQIEKIQEHVEQADGLRLSTIKPRFLSLVVCVRHDSEQSQASVTLLVALSPVVHAVFSLVRTDTLHIFHLSPPSLLYDSS